MILWIEGKNRSELKVVVLWLLFSLGFFSGFGVMLFIHYADKILNGG